MTMPGIGGGDPPPPRLPDDALDSTFGLRGPQTDAFGGILVHYPRVEGADEFGGFPVHTDDSDVPWPLRRPDADIQPAFRSMIAPDAGNLLPGATPPRPFDFDGSLGRGPRTRYAAPSLLTSDQRRFAIGQGLTSAMLGRDGQGTDEGADQALGHLTNADAGAPRLQLVADVRPPSPSADDPSPGAGSPPPESRGWLGRQLDAIGDSVARFATSGLLNLDNDRRAAEQGVTPVMRGVDGRLNYQKIGDAVNTDGGPMLVGPDGRWHALDVSRQVLLRDPDTGALAVYARTPAIEESPLAAAGRLFGSNILSPVTRLPGGIAAAGRGATALERAAPEVSAARRPPPPGSRGGQGTAPVELAGGLSEPPRPAAAPTPNADGPSPGPMIFRSFEGATPEELAEFQAYVDASNDAWRAGKLAPGGPVRTAGDLRKAADRAAAGERRRAAAAGTPYTGDAAHAPDTTWTGDPIPHKWLDLSRSVNGSLGGQAQRWTYPFPPEGFELEEPKP